MRFLSAATKSARLAALISGPLGLPPAPANCLSFAANDSKTSADRLRNQSHMRDEESQKPAAAARACAIRAFALRTLRRSRPRRSKRLRSIPANRQHSGRQAAALKLL